MFLCVMLLFLYVILNLIYARNICWKRNQKKKDSHACDRITPYVPIGKDPYCWHTTSSIQQDKP